MQCDLNPLTESHKPEQDRKQWSRSPQKGADETSPEDGIGCQSKDGFVTLNVSLLDTPMDTN